MSKVEEIFTKFEGMSDLGDQASVFYLLNARIASGLENKEIGSE